MDNKWLIILIFPKMYLILKVKFITIDIHLVITYRYKKQRNIPHIDIEINSF